MIRMWLNSISARKTIYLLMIFLSQFAYASTSVQALSQADRDAIYNDSVWYKIGGSSAPSDCGSGDDSPDLIGSSVGEQIYNFFVGVGLKPWQAAGIIGNMTAESGLEPQRLQGTAPGTITPAETFSGGLGWGIVQWTPGSKMIDTFSPKSLANDLGNQLNFLWEQLEGRGPLPEKQAGDELKSTQDVENATVAFQGTPPGGTVTYNGKSYGPYYGFERPFDKQGTIAFRINKAKKALARYGGSTTEGGPVLTCDSGVPAGAKIDMANLYKDSTNVGCAPPTRNIGVYDGYANEEVVKIRLCALPNLPSTGEESNGGYGVTGGNGDALVNSRVSGAWYALIEAMKKAGINIGLGATRAGSSFRTMAHQQALCAANSACSSGVYTSVAKPGTSNHQMGLAIDFGDIYDSVGGNAGPCTQTSPLDSYKWLAANSSNFGIKQYCGEAWHFSPTGS